VQRGRGGHPLALGRHPAAAEDLGEQELEDAAGSLLPGGLQLGRLFILKQNRPAATFLGPRGHPAAPSGDGEVGWSGGRGRRWLGCWPPVSPQ
jgi:hypothetical protein